MSVASALLAAQTTRFERLDALLPPAAPLPDGHVLTAALRHGDRVAGSVVRIAHEPDAAATLWSARHVLELYPLLGDADAAGMEALLREFARVVARTTPAPDSACVVTWPSRDAPAAGPLLGHGFAPLSVLAVRTGAAPPPPAGPAVRPAGPADLDAVVDLELAELAYSTDLGVTPPRADAAEIRRASLAHQLGQGEPVWLAERDGVAVGVAHCRLIDVATTSALATRLRPGRWGYVNSVSVLPTARGTGVGRELMAVAHHELHTAGATATFLYHHPVNPLASVFWARQGYRPLWTGWEVRPAGALR
jgi:GNAT superfamily N-acetyltransferase